MQERLCSRHIVLLGIGHTNAHVVRMWGMNPLPDTDLTCISDFSASTYSGMLPAVLAGQKTRSEMQIDLVRLCRSVNARLILSEVSGLDHERREVLFRDRPPVPFDVLSVGIGSVPTTAGVSTKGDSRVAIKPMQTFQDRLAEAFHTLPDSGSNRPLRLIIVGGGVAGVEVALCLPHFMQTLTNRSLRLQVVTRSKQLLPTVEDSTRKRVETELERRAIQVVTASTVTEVHPQRVTFANGTRGDADLVIWATGASAPPMLKDLNLRTSDRGFLLTDATLRCVDTQSVFAVGDTGTIEGEDVPKAGVYAVRQGPVLWDNIRRTLNHRPLQQYEPQRSFLKLINKGDRTAIGQWKGFSFSGTWVWRLKDFIDSRFMEKYQPQSAMQADGPPMQCRGCGCKLSAQTLDAALADSVTLGDAAEIGGDAGGRLMASTDFFSSPVDDAWLFGRIAALHAASDLVASGASVTHALANVVISEGDGLDQQRLLRDYLAGARREFEAMGAQVVGGHTIVGPRFEGGFTVFGRTLGLSPLSKGGLRPGDRLVLTKPLGIGILLAAHMRSACPAADYEVLLQTMLEPQHELARIAVAAGISAATDVTGFGLAGHLLEMLRASDAAATLRLGDIPILPGVTDLVNSGIESSLAPSNRQCESQASARDTIRDDERFSVLFDPQTCGGLLLGVPPENQDQFLSRARAAGLCAPVCIGEIHDFAANTTRLTVE